MKKIGNWPLKNSANVFKSRPFNVLEKYYQKPENEGVFTAYVLQMPDWVNIIPITPEKKVVLIRQFRFGTDQVELEIPGGCINPGEAPNIAAARELEEETGYRVGPSGKLFQLGVVNANPAIQVNKCYTYLAENATPSGTLNWDPDEMIELELFTLANVRNFIQTGKITNAYIIAAFYWLAQYQKKV